MKNFRIIPCLILFLVHPISVIAQDHTAWTAKAALYEVNVRQYTKAGTFNAFRAHLDRLREMGVRIIWLMPIHPIGSMKRLGSLGSYYAVKDYYGINPEFGTADDFRALVDSIHAKGMYVMMDWVANHTSWDNVLTTTHPDYYVKNAGGSFVAPPGTTWSDVIQLDFSNTAMRTYMIDAMKYWVTTMKVDGFRYDAASYVPIGFWSEVSAALKALKPDIFLLAEDQGTKYAGAGIPMTFAWSFYGFGGGILPKLYAGTNTANDLASYLEGEPILYSGDTYRLYFTSNHDENSWSGTDAELFGPAADAFLALASVMRGMPLIYGGQEAGLDHRLKFFDKDEIVWKTHPRAAMITALLHLKERNSALWNGSKGSEPDRVTTSNDAAVFAFRRTKGTNNILAAFNLSSSAKTFTMNGSGFTGTYKDVLTDSTVVVTTNLQWTLPAWGFRILEQNSSTAVAPAKHDSPATFLLSQNYPNPFNPSTNISYSIPTVGVTTLSVFNVIGQEVATVVDQEQNAGAYTVRFDASGLPSGVYVYRIRSGTFTDARTMLLMK